MADNYSKKADEQLDELERSDPPLYDLVLEVCYSIFDDSDTARQHASAITTPDGIRFATTVPGRWPLRVFWSSGPRIEAIFPYEFRGR